MNISKWCHSLYLDLVVKILEDFFFFLDFSQFQWNHVIIQYNVLHTFLKTHSSSYEIEILAVNPINRFLYEVTFISMFVHSRRGMVGNISRAMESTFDDLSRLCYLIT